MILKTEELAEHIHAKKNISILDTNMLFREKKRTEFLSIQDDNLSMCLSFLEKELDKSKGQ